MSDELCPVELRDVGEDRFGYDYLLLEDEQGRQLPIYCGKCEAHAIRLKFQAFDAPRPMTHDLLCDSVERLGGRLTRLVIDDLWQNAFYSKLCVKLGDGEEAEIDCRPGDGLAMAIRAGVPILVRDDVMEEGKVVASDEDGPATA